jgi:hypothetical protein
MIRRPSVSGLVEELYRAAAGVEKTRSFTVLGADVRSIDFTAYFPVSSRRGNTSAMMLSVELRSPGIEVEDSPAKVSLRKNTDTQPLSFLVRSRSPGLQTLKVKVTCDDQELINGLLRTNFVEHGGPGSPGGPTAYVQTTDSGERVLVLVETDLLVRMIALKDKRPGRSMTAGA